MNTARQTAPQLGDATPRSTALSVIPRKVPYTASPTKDLATAEDEKKKWPRMKQLVGTVVTDPIERAVFAAYADYANPDQNRWPAYVSKTAEGFLAWCSIKTVSQVTCLSESSCRRATQRLEQKGALLCVYRSTGFGQPSGASRVKDNAARASAYFLTPDRVAKLPTTGKIERNEQREDFPVDPCTTDTPVCETPLYRGHPDPCTTDRGTPVPGTPKEQINSINNNINTGWCC